MLLYYLSAILLVCANSAVGFDWEIDNFEVWYPENITDEFTTKCFGDLGCFYTGPPFFHPMFRPISVPPQDDIQTKFYLFTRSNPTQMYDLKPTLESLRNSPFDGKKLTKMCIHGYEQNYTQFVPIKDELLNYADYNVIILDHSHDAGPPYWQAIANARVGGANGAKLLNFLIAETEQGPEDIHVIGHSLGGQVSAYIGKRVKGLSRITGLDPAGIYFAHSPPEVRLDKSDAEFVDIIHTNAGLNAYEGEGDIFSQHSHASFYPNGGNRMPGCDRQHYLNITVVSTTFGNQCSHARSDDFFLTSIQKCTYESHMCPNYPVFKHGLCDHKPTNRMGLHATKPEKPLAYFLDTAADEPYCEVRRRPWGQ